MISGTLFVCFGGKKRQIPDKAVYRLTKHGGIKI